MAKRGGFPGAMPGNMNNLMKQAQKMQRQMEEQQKELETKEFTAAAGGGAVCVRSGWLLGPRPSDRVLPVAGLGDVPWVGAAAEPRAGGAPVARPRQTPRDCG